MTPARGLRPLRAIYPSAARYWANTILFPLKQVVPQPVVRGLPVLTSNEDIRIGLVRVNVRGRLLDIGCGGNRLVREYRAGGGAGVGVDVHDWGQVDHVVPDSSSLPFAEGAFDTVTFVACLNHIPNRAAVLGEAARVLAPGGRVLLTCLGPLVSRLWHAYAWWDEDQRERGMAEGEVFGFARGELDRLASQAGLRIVERLRFSWGLNELVACEHATGG